MDNKEVWVVKDPNVAVVEGPFVFEQKGGGWVKVKGYGKCLRPSQVFDSEKEAWQKILKTTDMRIRSLQKRKEKIEFFVINMDKTNVRFVKGGG